MAALLLASACGDVTPVGATRMPRHLGGQSATDAEDDAFVARAQVAEVAQVAQSCAQQSALLRFWLRLLQIPDECAPVTTTPNPPNGPDAPSGPSVGPIVRNDHPVLPPPSGPGPRVVSVGRAEQDETFPGLGTGDIDVQHYDLDFRWDPYEVTLEARATITLSARTLLTAVPLDFGGQLDVTEATISINGGAASVVASNHVLEKLVLPLPAPLAPSARVVATVHYRGAPRPVAGGAPIPLGWTVHDDGAVGTMSEPDAAHAWYPCNDHPTDKATYRTRITVPEGYVGVGNGVQQGASVANSDGTVSYSWLMDAPMAPYLALVAIDALSASEQGTTLGVTLRNYLPRGREGDFSASLAIQPSALSFLAERLGPYPFREYGAVVVPGPTVALETQGRSIFQGDSATDEVTVVHELAHQWMGNSVTLTRWQSDIWWVEGFARYSEWLWLEQTQGKPAYDERAERARRSLGTGRGWALTRAPVNDLFTQAIYDGGALVFHELRSQLGDETFYAALRAFCARFQYGNATSDDLLQVFSEVAGRDVAPLIAALLTGSRD